MHLKSPSFDMHIAPFLHGFDSQISSCTSQSIPPKPGGQSHLNVS